MTTFFRELTGEERKDTTIPGTMDVDKLFRFNSDAHEQKCTRDKVPYCRRCAWMEFERLKKIKMMELEERGLNSLGTEDEMLNIAKKFNFAPFTGRDYFDLVGVNKVENLVFINFNKVPKHTHNDVMLECKRFKHRYAVSVEADKWEEWETKYISKKEKKEIEIPVPEITDVKTVR